MRYQQLLSISTASLRRLVPPRPPIRTATSRSTRAKSLVPILGAITPGAAATMCNPARFDKGLSESTSDSHFCHFTPISTTPCQKRRGLASRARPRQARRKAPITMKPDRKLIAEILHTANWLTTARNKLFAATGMTGAGLRLLRTVRRLPIPFTVSQLARVMQVSRQTVQSTVRILEAAHLIRVELNLRNRKSPIITITTLGHERMEEAERLEQRWIADVTRGLTEPMIAQTAWVIRMVRTRIGD
jgi:DNA-binding MarR family transcriptional regulator